MCFWGFSQSNCDGAPFAQIGHQQLTLLPSKLVIGTGRKALVVAVQVVNDYGFFKNELTRTGTADEDDHGCQ